MSIRETLDNDLKTAMRARDSARVNCIRQLRAQVQKTQNAEGFSGEEDDDFYQQQIGSYVKSLKKAIAEMESAGDRTADLRSKYQAEVDYLGAFLPKLLDEVQTAALVDAAIAEHGISDPKQAGRLMGMLMKTHRDQLDPGVAKQVIEARLSAGA